MDEAFVTRFWLKIDIGSNEQCWLWKSSKQRDGYGQVTMRKNRRKKWLQAHRVAYALTFGEIPAGMHVLHACDNRACCNPNHMRLGTHADNMRDMFSRGRNTRTGRDYRTKPKLNVEAVREIRAAVGVPKIQLARRYGISARQVRDVLESHRVEARGVRGKPCTTRAAGKSRRGVGVFGGRYACRFTG